VNSVFALHALAAKKTLQLQNRLRRHAVEKTAIHSSRSKTNPSNSQTADFPDLRGFYINGWFRRFAI
jgi:hypothetical protein